MKRNVTVAVGALCLAAAGWAVAYGQDRPPQETPPPQQRPTPPPSQMQQPPTGGGTQAMNEVCPVGIEGLQAQVMTIPEGGALQLTVAEAQVSELRSRMERFVQIHDQSIQQRQRSGATGGGATGGGSTGGSASAGGGTGGGAQAGGGTGGGAQAGGSMQAQPRFADENALIHQAQEVRVVEIPRGVRLEVRQLPSAQLDALRSELRQTAQQLTQGRCPLALQIEQA